MPIEPTEELTEHQAFEAILVWSADRPVWQRDALRRLVVNGRLTETDIDELTVICCDSKAPVTPLAKEHLKKAAASNEPISLRRLGQPQGINALPDDQEIEFAPAGLSIIYGDNGSGKSGYVRVLKHACRTRDGQTTIRRDVEDTKSTPQSAAIVFTRGSAEDIFDWTPQAPAHAELPSVSIFDTRSANIHVEKTNAVAYVPEPMQVLEALAAACDAIKERIDAQASRVRSQTPIALSSPSLSKDTAAGSFVHNLSSKSNIGQLDLLSTLSPNELKRLAEIQADLTQDPQKASARLQTHRARLVALQTQFAKFCSAASDAAFVKREELRAELQQKREAARLASEALFVASPLPEVGQDIWRSLWDAARQYSDQVAYPAKKFPQFTAGDDLCVLCQQPLPKEAIDRQLTFEAYIQSTTRADEQRAETALRDFVEANQKLRIKVAARREALAFIGSDVGDETLAKTIRKAMTVAAWRLRALLKTNAAPCPATEFPQQACEALTARLAERITQLSADDASPERQALLKECHELKDRQALGPLLEDIKAQVERCKEIALLDAVAKDTAKRAVTNKNKELSDRLVTSALRGRFAREVQKLKLSRMPVELRKVKDSNATSYFQVALVEKPNEPIGEILSEGEHRCIALAAFLAELVTSKKYSGIVFDDPMSSLDHIHRKAVAARLVEEAAHRQVVVFTHDLTFLYELRREAEAKDQQVHYQTVSRRSDKPGFVEGDLPNKARNALQLANALRSELKSVKPAFDKWPEIRRTLFSKGLIEQLREGWDQAIADFIYPVLGRFDNKIAGGSLYKLAILQDADVTVITEARSRLSEGMHVSALTLNPASITHTQLIDEVKKLEDWVHSIHERQKAAVAPKISHAK